MVRASVGRLASLGIGAEVYFDNTAVMDTDRDAAKEAGRVLADHGIPCTCHAPFMDLSPGGVDREVRLLTVEKLKRAVERACLMGARSMVAHGGYDKWRFGGHEQRWLEGSIETWTELLKEAGDMPLMVENIFEETPATLTALFDCFREKNLWCCFDTGHFNLFTTIPLEGWLMPLRTKLKELHLHDNHGKSDEHLAIGRGTFPFRELKPFLKMLDGVFFTAETPDESSAPEVINNMKEFLS